jgi:hypothetical protein
MAGRFFDDGRAALFFILTIAANYSFNLFFRKWKIDSSNFVSICCNNIFLPIV